MILKKAIPVSLTEHQWLQKTIIIVMATLMAALVLLGVPCNALSSSSSSPSTGLSTSASSSSMNSELLYVAGRRCLLVQAQKDTLYPPIILMGGMAQTISSWEHHLPSLSRNRQVLIYECIGQGLPIPNCRDDCGNGNNRDTMYFNVSLPFQAESLMKTLDAMDGMLLRPNNGNLVDIVGFSFGARVAMAAACLYPNRIRKMHLTGIATDRSNYGHLAVSSWKDCLKVSNAIPMRENNDDGSFGLRPFAWSILLATYSSEFLRKSNCERFVQHICDTNHPPGLLALFEQAEINDTNDPWHVQNMAKTLRNTVSSPPQGHICVGELDQMAPVEHVEELCSILKWEKELSIIANCAHAVGMEAPRNWRESVLKFLDS